MWDRCCAVFGGGGRGWAIYFLAFRWCWFGRKKGRSEDREVKIERNFTSRQNFRFREGPMRPGSLSYSLPKLWRRIT